MKGLKEFLNKGIDFNKDGLHIVDGDFIVPGYWAALAAYSRANSITFDQLGFTSNKVKGYAPAIALEKALGGIDRYPYERKNSGENYSELVLLNSVDDTDKANGTINSCIRKLFASEALSNFVKDLCDVVGDLHDNVWSHGRSTGFSMAQKWKNPINNEGFFFEFALADCGLGFLSELKRVGLPIQCDESAISWCIEKGNSSKKLKDTDDGWSQRLPPDSTGNPMPGISKIVTSENHHMGLGLAKLTQLVTTYQGDLWLSSGEKTLFISSDGTKSFTNNAQRWQGVALACRFDTTKASNNNNKHNEDEAVDSLLELIRG